MYVPNTYVDSLVDTFCMLIGTSLYFPQVLFAMASTDRAALVALFRSTNGAAWWFNNNWDVGAQLSTWHGVEVNREGRLVKLGLTGNSLQGIRKTYVLQENLAPVYNNLPNSSNETHWLQSSTQVFIGTLARPRVRRSNSTPFLRYFCYHRTSRHRNLLPSMENLSFNS